MLPAFRPYEVPGPETSNAVMGALLIHDLNAPDHAGRPGTRLANPQQIFSDGAFHGGAWRCGYAFDSIGAVAVVLYYLQRVLLRAYLVGYNAVQTFGWCTVALRVAAHLAVGATDAPWASFGEPLLFYQNLALLEVLHATLGAVRAPVVTTAAQIASRVAVVNVASAVVDVHTAWPLFVVGLAWSATEVVRYSWCAPVAAARACVRARPWVAVCEGGAWMLRVTAWRHGHWAARVSPAWLRPADPPTWARGRPQVHGQPPHQASDGAHVAALFVVHRALPSRSGGRAAPLPRGAARLGPAELDGGSQRRARARAPTACHPADTPPSRLVAGPPVQHRALGRVPGVRARLAHALPAHAPAARQGSRQDEGRR